MVLNASEIMYALLVGNYCLNLLSNGLNYLIDGGNK